MSDIQSFSVELEQRERSSSALRFDWPGVAEVVRDEPEPLGKRRGPRAARPNPAERRRRQLEEFRPDDCLLAIWLREINRPLKSDPKFKMV